MNVCTRPKSVNQRLLSILRIYIVSIAVGLSLVTIAVGPKLYQEVYAISEYSSVYGINSLQKQDKYKAAFVEKYDRVSNQYLLLFYLHELNSQLALILTVSTFVALCADFCRGGRQEEKAH